MRSIWALLLVAVAVCQAKSARIVGGHPTSIQQYPSIVQLETNWYLDWYRDCAAVILNARTIVSAAHCFEREHPSRKRIRAGSSFVNSGVIVYIERYLNHPYYEDPERVMEGDISIVVLSSYLMFGPRIQPVPIPLQGFELPDGLPVVYAGWGDTISGVPSSSDVLLSVTVYTINRELCSERYGGLVTDTMICAGIQDEGGKDACTGDSGGPLYYDNILVGIIAWGADCGHEYLPGVNTRVSAYTDWLSFNAV